MIWWPILYAALSFAADPVVEEYCFTSPALMKNVLQKSRFIFVPSDKVQEEGTCFSISTAPHRRELIQNYVRNIEPSTIIRFSSAELKRDHCHIRVEKIKRGSTRSTDIALHQNSQIGALETSRESTEVTSVQTMKSFSLVVNQDTVQGECSAITPNRYEITLTVKKDPIPLLPPVPAGTIVVVPQAEAYKVQPTMNLQTTVQLNRGEKIEVAKIVRDLHLNSKSGSLTPEVSAGQSWGEDTEKIFLSLE
jgi:hypothetical protein